MKDNTLFDVRIIIVIVVVVGAFTGWNLWTNRNNLSKNQNGSPSEGIDSPIEGMDRFEGYGFSIDYPSEMSIELLGEGRAGEANESMGHVEGTLIGKSVDLCSVDWFT